MVFENLERFNDAYRKGQITNAMEYVIKENVKNFATHDNGRTLEVVKSTMEELGYQFNQTVLNATDFGMPQKRERIYMVCFRNDLGTIDFSYPKPFKLTKYVKDFLLED